MRAQRFEQLYSEGIRVAGPNFRLLSLEGSGQFGVATSRQIGSKPRRNRIKRRVKSVIAQLGLPNALDVVIVCKSSADALEYTVLQNEIGRLLDETRKRWDEKSE